MTILVLLSFLNDLVTLTFYRRSIAFMSKHELIIFYPLMKTRISYLSYFLRYLLKHTLYIMTLSKVTGKAWNLNCCLCRVQVWRTLSWKAHANRLRRSLRNSCQMFGILEMSCDLEYLIKVTKSAYFLAYSMWMIS